MLTQKEFALNTIPTEHILHQFAQKEHFSEQQLDQFKMYYELLAEWSQKINLTAITSLEDIVTYHFEDSLYLSHCYDLNTIHHICDIGTGAGFPAIPLKIKYPHLHFTLLEVNNKKVTFLRHVIQALGLENIIVDPIDWRTFLRVAQEPMDMFISRAALQPQDLLRGLSPAFGHQDAILVYWASDSWQETDKEAAMIMKKEAYIVGTKNRKLIFFHKPKA